MASQPASHARDPSFIVRFSRSQILTVSQEIYDGTVADVTLNLFTIWIRDAKEHYELAKEYIRELGLDQGYATNRITNDYLRQLLDDCLSLRPSAPPFSGELKALSGKNTPRSSGAMSSPLAVRSSSHGSFGAESRPSPLREFPPNTPDRPAPLKIRSAGGRSGTETSVAKSALLRSVSSPIGMRQAAYSLQSRVPMEILAATATVEELTVVEAAEDDTSRVLDKGEVVKQFIDELPENPQEFNWLEKHAAKSQRFNLFPPTSLADRRAALRAGRQNQTTGNILPDTRASGINRPLPLRHAISEVWRSARRDQHSTEHSQRLHHPSSTDSLSSLAGNAPSITGEIESPRPNGRATSMSKLDKSLPLRRYNTEASSPHRRAHPMRSVSQPVPAHVNNGEKIEGLQELTRRIDATTSKARALAKAHSPYRATWSAISNDSTPSRRTSATSATLRPPQEGNPLDTSAPNKEQQVRPRITAEYMATALEQIRARGRNLPTIRHSDLDAAEVRWREDNQVLIYSLYGRNNLLFTEKDKEFVDFVAGQLKENLGRGEGLEWVAMLFRKFD